MCSGLWRLWPYRRCWLGHSPSPIRTIFSLFLIRTCAGSSVLCLWKKKERDSISLISLWCCVFCKHCMVCFSRFFVFFCYYVLRVACAESWSNPPHPELFAFLFNWTCTSDQLLVRCGARLRRSAFRSRLIWTFTTDQLLFCSFPRFLSLIYVSRKLCLDWQLYLYGLLRVYFGRKASETRSVCDLNSFCD